MCTRYTCVLEYTPLNTPYTLSTYTLYTSYKHPIYTPYTLYNTPYIRPTYTLYPPQGLASDSISGDRSQSQRETTIRKFKEGRVTVVIATDVAARGLDIKGIQRVINYELPIDDFQVRG